MKIACSLPIFEIQSFSFPFLGILTYVDIFLHIVAERHIDNRRPSLQTLIRFGASMEITGTFI